MTLAKWRVTLPRAWVDDWVVRRMMTDEDIFDHFSGTVSRDFFRMITGEVLGAGVFRVVYDCPLRTDLVLKFESSAGDFQNVIEWEFWEANKEDKKTAAWLAPCEFISPCGTVLAMKKTTKPTLSDYPKNIPEFLTDRKYANFGMLDGKLVAHDYGLYSVKIPMRLRKADWWGSTP